MGTDDQKGSNSGDKRCVVIRHVHCEDLGSMALPILRAGYRLEWLEAPLALENDFKRAAEADLLVLLGAPVGVYDTEAYPFINFELEMLRRRLGGGQRLRTLGICVGAQLIAGALGCRVFPSGTMELGWWPISVSTTLPATSPVRQLFGDADELMMLHWHGDTFDLPGGATRLASSAAVREQGFAIDDRVLAWQCHPEILPASIGAWLTTHCGELMGHGGADLVQVIRRDTASYADALVPRCRAMLTAWLLAA